MKNSFFGWLITFGALALTACGGGGPAVGSVVITPSAAQTLAVGGKAQLSAQARDAGGNPLSPQPTITWTSSAPAVASVSAGGEAAGLTVGSANITASVGSVSSSPVAVTVRPATARIVLTPGAAQNTFIGNQTAFTAQAQDAAGNAVSPQPAFTWASSAPLIANANPNGTVVSLGAGTANITASADGVTSSPVTMTVRHLYVLEAALGSVRFSNNSENDTAVVLRLRRNDGATLSLAGQTFRVIGPGAWGTTTFTVGTPDINSGLPQLRYLPQTPEAGSYTVAPVASIFGCDCNRTVTLGDAGPATLAFPVVSVQSASAAQIGLSWSAVSGAVSYRAVAFQNFGDPNLASTVTGALSLTLGGLALNPANFYRASVEATNLDLASATAALPAKVEAAVASGVPVILAPAGSSYQVSSSAGTDVDTAAPGRVNTIRAVRVLTAGGATPPAGLLVGYAVSTPDAALNTLGFSGVSYDQRPTVIANAAAPLAGAYGVRALIAGGIYDASASIPNLASTLGFATLSFGAVTASSVPVSWSAPAGALSYAATLIDTTNNTTVQTSGRQTATSFTFTPSAPLVAGRAYQVAVVAYNANLTANDPLPAQLNRSISRADVPPRP